MMSQWQPIETAPKDGTQILVTWADTWDTGGPHIELCEYGGERWMYTYDGDCPSEPPTHWMQRPNGPND